MNFEQLYEDYVLKTRRLVSLSSIQQILGWDQQTMMPSGAGTYRATQMSSLAGIVHEISTDPELGRTLKRLFDAGPESFDPYQWRNIEDSFKSYQEAKRLPVELMERAASLESVGFSAWGEARKNNDFSIFAPFLEEWVELRKRMTSSMYPDKDPYEVCLDAFEKGVSLQWIDSVFGELQSGIINLREELQGDAVPQLPEGIYCSEVQKRLAREIAAKLGFDFGQGRLDTSAHPFTLDFHRSDVRITVRYEEHSIIQALAALTHECGHAMYQQGLMRGDHEQLPVAGPLGMMIHESQSLIWERMVFQGKAFWRHFQPLISESFPETLAGFSSREFYRSFNRVSPGCIRTSADELCYPLHIMLRYEIERDLFSGALKTEDIPRIWNEKSEHLIGVRPGSDNEGALQDVHWSGGAFGYFPLYTLGAIAGAQFYHQAREEIQDLDGHLASGGFPMLRDWLNRKIHQKGRLLGARELLRDVTGKDLDTQAYLAYLRDKYTEIYRLN